MQWMFERDSNMTERLVSIIDNISFSLNILLTLYLAVSVVYLFQDVSIYHATFLVGTVVISAVEYVKMAVDRNRYDEPFRGPLQIVLSLILLLTAIVVTTYIAFSATRLQTIQPFITDLDVMFGWLFIVVVLYLITIHWGKVLGGVIALSIAYFIWGHRIPIEMMAHP
ncbi:unnamed protein product, partial [marine sediment metagenome]